MLPNFNGFIIMTASVFGEAYAWLWSAKLKGANLRYADLSNAKFFLANLESADLSNTNRGGAKFTQANLWNAIGL